jgi:hypothetical protein
MKAFRWLGAGLLWILAGVVGLVGGLLSITIILLPVGIPLLMLARKLGGLASALLIPKAVRHPVQELGDRSSDASDALTKGGKGLFGKGRKAVAEASPPDTGKLRKKAAQKLGKRRGTDRLKPWR